MVTSFSKAGNIELDPIVSHSMASNVMLSDTLPPLVPMKTASKDVGNGIDVCSGSLFVGGRNVAN